LKNRKKILILISHYLPGQNIGGPLNSVKNITDLLRSEFDFFIVTSDRDLGSKVPYPNIEKNKWLLVGGTPVMYLKLGFNYYRDVLKLLQKNNFDALYVNSFFDFRFSVYIVLLRYVNLIHFKRVVVAPRGELMDNSIYFNRLRKIIFIRIINISRLYEKVIWHSTSAIETLGIKKRINNAVIVEAGVLVDSNSSVLPMKGIKFDCKDANILKLVFISRISKDKNILFALRVLKMVTCKVEFHIYGPIEDEDVWNACLDEMKKLPLNVLVAYRGIIAKDLVKSYFSQYELFFLPTYGENFGHVINESLSVGTPVLISDRTPWVGLEDKGLGWDFSLESTDQFVKTINNYSKLTYNQKLELRAKINSNYIKYFNLNELVKQNINIFK
jgi:glycosyltransferase involved in cell wall biosynthesis